jgi:hypothetical protein
MHVATIETLPFTRHAATMALESDAGMFDVDAVTHRADLHRLFEGAVIVSEIDEFVDFGTIGFDADLDD